MQEDGLSTVGIVLKPSEIRYTSFNENEPVVCRPEEALDCFLRTKIDHRFSCDKYTKGVF
jgi:predicted NodU family carbamoyl transferase